MNEAAERYSPEMAEAFQPTDTARPATKKSEAVLDLRAAQKPIQIVTTTVSSEKQRIHGSVPLGSSRMPLELTARNGRKVISVLARCQFPSAPRPATCG